MHSSKAFLFFLLSFIGGIFYQSFWSLGLVGFWFVLVLSLIIFLVDYRNRNFIIWALVGVFFLLGVGRTEIELKKIESIAPLQKEISTQVEIIREPDKREYYQNLVVSLEKIKILVRTELYREFKYGDKIELRCQPEIVENSSEDFDYKMYLAKDGIYYICKKAEIIKLESDKNNLYSLILTGRHKLEENINKVIPEPEASLANGILFGGNRLSKEKQAIFAQTGMTHIVAVSGYNVTIIAQYLMLIGIFLGLWRRQAFYFAFLGIILFVAMIGFPSSAVRAGVMGLLILWAIKNGRLATADNALVLAGAMMLLINPLLLRRDIGFQLSFLATLGLIKLAPFWENYLMGKLKSLGFIEIVLMTISAQIFVLPIIMYNFHTFSAVSILANVLVLPIVPMTMLLVALTAIGGLVFYPLALLFGWMSYFLLKYVIGIIAWLGSFSWSALEINNFNEVGIFVWYLILFLSIKFITKKMECIKKE